MRQRQASEQDRKKKKHGTRTPVASVGKTPVRTAARTYLDAGWQPVTIPAGKKGPRASGWQLTRLGKGEVHRAFPPGSNIGILTGDASGGLVDVDIDSKLAVKAAARLLPRTAMRHGRPTNPNSHWWYRLADWRAGEKLARESLVDPVTRATIIELRADGCQTLVPPSFNDEIIDKATKEALPGEKLAWEEPRGDPAEVDREELRRAVHQVAAVAALAPHWKNGSRNDSSLALAGWLLKGGLKVETVERLLGALATTVKANEKKVRSVARATAGKIERGERVTGAGTLIDTFAFPRSVILQVGEWLGLVEDSTFSASSSLPSKWPAPLSPAAYPGLVGEIINTIDPHTEADKAAFSSTFL